VATSRWIVILVTRPPSTATRAKASFNALGVVPKSISSSEKIHESVDMALSTLFS
jgi:hypothetical protein